MFRWFSYINLLRWISHFNILRWFSLIPSMALMRFLHWFARFVPYFSFFSQNSSLIFAGMIRLLSRLSSLILNWFCSHFRWFSFVRGNASLFFTKFLRWFTPISYSASSLRSRNQYGGKGKITNWALNYAVRKSKIWKLGFNSIRKFDVKIGFWCIHEI